MPSIPKSEELYACLYLTEFPAQALLRLRPHLLQGLRAKPFVVMEGEPPMQQVCSLNAKAQVLGIRRGMTRVEADTFPSVTQLLRSLAEEAAAKAALLECCGAFSPGVEDLSTNGVFQCGIDIAGTEKLFGPPKLLGKTLLQRVRSLGFRACVAISRNFHAALCMARGIASVNQVKVIPSGEESTALAPLPLTVLDISEAYAETFALWGIHTLGKLAELPEKPLIARMGQQGKHLLELARGERPHLFQPVEPAFTLVERMELDSPVELLDSLFFLVGIMLEQLILRATSRIVALASVTIHLSLEGVALHTRTVRPALPTNLKQLWIKLIHLDLEAHPPQAAILALTLAAEHGKTSKVQLGLFSPQLPEPMRLDVTLARIRSIVGEAHVGRALLKDTYASDGYSIEPFSVPFSVLSRSTVPSTPRQPRASTRQMRPPASISVTLRDKQPETFSFHEKRYTVEHAYGPWLVSGDWWNPTLWSSEQWDLVARSVEGTLLCCCLCRDLVHGTWTLVSLYD